MKRTAIAAFAAAGLLGCASTPKIDPRGIEVAKEPLICVGKVQCDLFWQRAQVWLAANSRYRIQSATDTVISTHGPAQYSPERAYQVVRVPMQNDSARITISSNCANMFGCSTDVYERALSFKTFVQYAN